MRPYLKGIHLTVDSWRLGRDEDGFKDPTWCGPPVESGEAEPEAPETVKAVKGLSWDLEALSKNHTTIWCSVGDLRFW
jgi:hypothetical protein